MLQSEIKEMFAFLPTQLVSTPFFLTIYFLNCDFISLASLEYGSQSFAVAKLKVKLDFLQLCARGTFIFRGIVSITYCRVMRAYRSNELTHGILHNNMHYFLIIYPEIYFKCKKLEYCKTTFYVFVGNKTVLSCTLLNNLFWSSSLIVS